MAIFNFKRQLLHTQLDGRTSGREMFKVDEYNQVKKTNAILGCVMFLIFTSFYFLWNSIGNKFKGFMAIIFVGCAIWFYFNMKHQIKVKRSLY